MKINRLGLLLTLAILLAVIAFGVFKRKGARKPPPIPEEATGSWQGRTGPGRAVLTGRRV